MRYLGACDKYRRRILCQARAEEVHLEMGAYVRMYFRCCPRHEQAAVAAPVARGKLPEAYKAALSVYVIVSARLLAGARLLLGFWIVQTH